MPAIIVLLLRAIGWSLVPLGWKLLRGLGFTAVTYTGLKLVLDQAKEHLFSLLGSTPAAWVQVLGLMQFDVAINIVFSAYIARAVLSGMDGNGSKSGMRWTGPK
ncbi:DUF2523 domain-containing protein [Pseudomonas citronellolis]|uniref:DUF2523 domain-containing protein n=1 Tax=Pseudomonas citronellolis TaxID=53408 RepID=UPI00211175AA|nr:DUF2523 domain-containing protein [Pseudomonas citronellolis]UUC47477.1 DUF2523 domain-containing protein [Pseudomonas citronellolis]UUC47488.1 DUF2523 domain-containing protein [Pseudomonas citronellolis]UUC47499.1 DUF2523 domain-containing protein [Pseudomonas citronellolis]